MQRRPRREQQFISKCHTGAALDGILPSTAIRGINSASTGNACRFATNSIGWFLYETAPLQNQTQHNRVDEIENYESISNSGTVSVSGRNHHLEEHDPTGEGGRECSWTHWKDLLILYLTKVLCSHNLQQHLSLLLPTKYRFI